MVTRLVRAKSLLVGGTASHAGKSFVATAICRLLKRRGVKVAPFKAQNMSLNSYPCADGGEIGRAQVVQAEACGLDPVSDMNPVLLKPNGNMSSQVVLNGKVWKNLSARDYYEHTDFLLSRVLEAYERLAGQYEYIVMEGAGSIAEMNLRHRDIVNLGLARKVGAPVLVVADIDRGGVFASVVGTYCLLPPEERGLLRSFAVNRFRGDPRLFDDGVKILEQKTASRLPGSFSDARRRRDRRGGQRFPRRPRPVGIDTHRHPAIPPHFELHRFPPDPCRPLDHGPGRRPLRHRHPARHEEHARRSGLDAPARPR